MENKHPIYARFNRPQLILRDELAIDRTLLANERTLLAYLRSGMALLIAGATMIQFSQPGWFLAIGIACMPLGLLCAIIGIVRYRKVNKSILLVRNIQPCDLMETEDSDHAIQEPEA